MNDLFEKPKTMRQRVMEYCKQKGFINSIDLENLKDTIKKNEGIVKGLLRIHREARDLATEGILRRLDKDEKLFRGMNTAYATYEWIAKE